MNFAKFKNLILNLFFPKFCFNCTREGDFLCQDCLFTLSISDVHKIFRGKNLEDLYFAIDYENFLVKKLIKNFKYPPLIKDLAKDLASIIITHFLLIDGRPNFSDFLILPVPLSKRKLRWRGFNQSEEIAKEISKFFKIPLISDCLIKIKETKDQVNLSEKERKENLKGVFSIQNKEKILGKRILLIDDVFTTGTTMEECAKVLKKAGTKEVIGIAIARAKPGTDKPDLI